MVFDVLKHYNRCSLLCASSYVCLCIGENHSALQAAKNLLNLKAVITTDQKFVFNLVTIGKSENILTSIIKFVYVGMAELLEQ